ncbi:MAG: phytanoyl-CoA dioxygenase family protein [Planctomycetota bacterium]|nr:phytanoyl-CoA dioxygenase family protein [Planctomycetota bacterium]
MKLNSEQVEHFVRQGFVHCPGLIGCDLIEKGLAVFEGETGLIPGDPGTWEKVPAGNLGEHGVHLDLSFLVTPEMADVAEQLCGSDIFCRGFTPILKMQVPGPKKFESPEGAHIDGMRAGLTLYPTLRYLVMLAYLTDTPIYGGPLCVHPGSHRQVFEYGYRTGADLSENWWKNKKTQAVDLPYLDKIPLPGKAGDVIFMHYLLVHSGSLNRSDHVRVGLNGVAREIEERPYLPKPGSPISDWTPIDRTLRTDNLEQAQSQVALS